MTLATFLKQIAVRVNEQGVPLPLRNQQVWHKVVYNLKTTNAPGRPAFLDELWFDWDGPAPEAPDVSEFLARLHWTASISANNPRYEVATLPKPIQDLWTAQAPGLNPEEEAFLTNAVELAKQAFQSVVVERDGPRGMGRHGCRRAEER